jgi:hypothetical protein
MSLLQSKKDIEQLFYDEWTETDIHWSGMKFDIENRDEWIRLQYKPYGIDNSGLSYDGKYSGVIQMAVFAKTEFRSLELADIAIALFRGNKIGTNYTMNTLIKGSGQTQDLMYNYVDIEISISTL